ncbi:MAG: hypothetical protein ISP73_03145 [Flavobacteriales bacterium]|nr:hypothetical protein [Flavobacteriales bacterium]
MVNLQEKYTQWVKQPHTLKREDSETLKELVDKYPFCQTSRLLYLKSLQNINSIHFNQSLKVTAAHASDRHQLFHLLTEKKSKVEKSKIKNVDKIDSQKTDETPKEVIKESLNIGQPLEFEKEETHSFSQWLKLSQAKPIVREKEENKLQEKVSLIEDFIANRERKPQKKEFYSATNQAKKSEKFEFDIVTETLAKVYLEQEHYEKAKEAYRQLCLKYPQKSSLFASQIELIDQLIDQNNK